MTAASSSDFVQFSIRLPRKTHAALEALAKRELSSMNREVNIAVNAHIDARKALLKGAAK